MPWDKIQSAHFSKFNDFSEQLPKLQALHEKRAGTAPDFKYLIETNQLIEERRQIKDISLNITKRRAEKKQLEDAQVLLENTRRKAHGLELISSIKELEDETDEKTNNADKSKKKDDEPTPLLTETGNILIDFINLNYPKIARKL